MRHGASEVHVNSKGRIAGRFYPLDDGFTRRGPGEASAELSTSSADSGFSRPPPCG